MDLQEMFKNGFQNNRDVTFQTGDIEIKLTKRTISFRDEVYQFRNIAGFGERSIKKKSIVPFEICIGVLLLGMLFMSMAMMKIWGILFVILSLVMIVINIKQPRKYGLLLTLNSGDKQLFVTTDRKNIKKVVEYLQKFIDNEQDGSCTIHITDNSINVDGNFTGIAATESDKSNLTATIDQNANDQNISK